MARKRGSPVLIELMATQPDGPSSPDALHAAPTADGATSQLKLRLADEELETKPTAVTASGATMAMPPQTRREGIMAGPGWLRQIAKLPPVAWLAVGLVVLMLAGVWYLAFRTGQTKQAQQDDQRRLRELGLAPEPSNAAPGNPTLAQPQQPLALPTVPQPRPQPEQPAAPALTPALGAGASTNAIAADAQLIAGNNYLVCGIFKRQSDADAAAAYLVSKGLPARIITPNQLSAGSSGKDFMVIIQKGYSREEYRASGLREKVQSLGRMWRAEDKRAPTDFAQPYWDRYKDR